MRKLTKAEIAHRGDLEQMRAVNESQAREIARLESRLKRSRQDLDELDNQWRQRTDRQEERAQEERAILLAEMNGMLKLATALKLGGNK